MIWGMCKCLFWKKIELVYLYHFLILFMPYFFLRICRRVMCIRKPFKLWSIQSQVQLRIILKSGQRQRQPTATSARVYSGVLPGRVWGVANVGSNVTRSVKIYSMLTVYNVSMMFIYCVARICLNSSHFEYFFLWFISGDWSITCYKFTWIVH